MNQTSRKANRISGYDYNQNGAYFVTVCTRNRQTVLCDIVGDDAHIVPKPYGLVTEKYIRNVPEIEKYVLMPDLIHMIIRLDSHIVSAYSAAASDDACPRTPSRNKISSIIRSIKTLTTKEIGIPIFQRSYYDHVIRNQEDYEEIWQYIDNNPKRWIMTHPDRG